MNTTTRTRRLSLTTAYVVAAIAGVESYSHIAAVAAAHGQNGVMSHLLPFSVDGLVLGGTLALAARRRNFTAWLAVVLGVVATLGANIAAAEPTAIGRAISAWPAVAFLISTEIVLKGASKAAEIIATVAATAEVDEALAAKRRTAAAKAAATRAANKAEADAKAEARRVARKAAAAERAAERAALQATWDLPAAPVSPAPATWDRVQRMLDQAQTA